MNTTAEIQNKIIELSAKWHDQIAIRDRNEYGSFRYNRAIDKADAIESEASMLVFGDTAHTMTECINGQEAE
jgi:hypothetical protein